MAHRIVQLTDLHLCAEDGRTVHGSDVWHNLRCALADVAARQQPFDLLVLSGDLANQRHPASYARLRGLLEPFAGRYRVLPGNHDSRRLLRAAFADQVPPDGDACFRTELGDLTVLGLDSVRRPFVHGRFGHRQLEWLARQLRSCTRAVAFAHHPPIRVGTWWLDKDRPRDRLALQRCIAGAPLLALFTGHVHQEASGAFAGVPVWTTPAVAYQFAARRPWPVIAARTPRYRVIDVDGAQWTTRVVDPASAS